MLLVRGEWQVASEIGSTQETIISGIDAIIGPRAPAYFSVIASSAVFRIGLVRYSKTVFFPILISAIAVIPG